ncbi:site-2 protease family protein [Candidatus Woesearchaeota archaeon]|nr:site-2 protease family protein [Candidatus Woesearchaeota archaeon]
MIDFQIIAAFVFLILLSIILYLKRKNLDTKQIIPYFLYFSMYRTKFGLNLMDSVSKKYRKFMVYLGYAGILIGFLGMALISYGLVNNLYVLFTKPEAAPGVGLVLPFKAKGIFYVPFFYWIISIFVIAVVHEFAHGLIARAHNLKVKSSGFAFLGLIVPVIPAAFVEPDEKALRKRPHKEQLSVFAAGPFSNIVIAFLFMAIASFVIAPIVNGIMEPNGVKITDYVSGNQTFPAENSGMRIGEIILEVDNKPTPYIDNLSTIMKTKKPGETATVKTDKSTYQIKLAKNPENESLAYLGAYLEQSTKVKDSLKTAYGEFIADSLIWVYGLFAILFILNFGIGLFNLVPLGPLDGGRMLQLALHKFFDKEKGDKVFYYVGIFFLVIIFVNIVSGFVK